MVRFLSIFTVLLCIGFLHAQEDDSTVVSEVKAAEIHWMTFEEALDANEQEPKKWLIDIYTDWCGWCKRMDATTFKDSLIVDYVNGHYYAVSFDAEQKGDVVVGETTYKFVAEGRRGYHELAAALMNGKMSYPTYVFLNGKLQNLSPIGGYKAAKDFLPILEFIFEYDPETNPINWETFLTEYDSPYAEPEAPAEEN